MEITNENLPWSSDDEFAWNAFLGTETGKRLLPKAAAQMPSLLDGADVNRSLVRMGEVRGFQFAVAAFLELTHSPPEPQKIDVTYPDLDDEKAWEQGIPTTH